MQLNFTEQQSLKHWLIIIAAATLCTACKKIDVFERTTVFPQHQWAAEVKPSFNFTITDTAARYNIYIVLRHADAYHYNNIWVNLVTIAPADTAQTTTANLKLGDNRQWLGNAFDDIIEHRIRINAYPVKLKQGNYRFILQQIMRENPLQYVLNAGVRIEKASI